MNRPLCCFLDPEFSNEPRSLDDVCPKCGKAYGFPLSDVPETIRDFTVVSGLNRGFYSAVFHVTLGPLETPYVLKVASKRIYAAFEEYGKNFAQECRTHRDVAAQSDHLVPIHDMFDTSITFGDVTLDCHVAQLGYVEGQALEDVLVEEPPPASRTIAQIALDLLQLLEELQARETFHNDLHDGNVIIQRLGTTSRRAGALDDSIRAIAIDLGSITDASKSGTTRLGDMRSVGRHLESFANRLLLQPGATSDLDYRLAGQLQEISAMLAADAVNQRPPEFAVLRDRIRQAYDFVASPWKQPPPLRSIDDSYNAQTLHPWFVPKLIVDPDGRWRQEISVQGPQVISGMRGCGKTMLLRALMVHARVASHQEDRTGLNTAEALSDDGYVGLYVSCNRLLDPLGSSAPLHQPEARLFVAYAREGLRAIRHLREIDENAPSFGAARRVGEVLKQYVDANPAEADSDDELMLERATLRMLSSLQRGEDAHKLLTDPSAAFVALAEAIRSSSPVWATSSIFYLLDDLSTRHLSEESIRLLASRLVFSSDVCAFKITTEEQTLEYVLKSPGLIEEARPGRDYKVFDLGAHVNQRMRAPQREGGGTNFIRDILMLRAEQYPGHPSFPTPADLLGDATLTSMAEQVATLPESSADRKQIYRGLRALTAVCVGDIGDVLAIYEAMIRQAGYEDTPIPAKIQHQAFLDYCAQRLYHINHRDGRFKDVAVGFAQAARDLLVASARRGERLRQYSSIYVRVTTDEPEEQFQQLRTLIDAGVFVLEGGAYRVKRRDDDPMLQFVLKFRKLFGLSSNIGLSDRDRFELSGEDLKEWLDEPKRGKEILMRNLGGPLPEVDDDDTEPPLVDQGRAAQRVEPMTLNLFSGPLARDEDLEREEARRAELAEARTPVVSNLDSDQLAATSIRSVVLGLGFEERTVVSATRLLEAARPDHVVLIRYDEPGFSAEIESLVNRLVPSVEVMDHRELGASARRLPPAGPTLVDVTGLTKPLIFQSVRRALARDGSVLVAHTQASSHYPLEDKIAPILAADGTDDIWALFDGLDDVWLGEAGPYTFEKLLDTNSDESRRRHLVASASPKHQRLLSLVESREFDRLGVLTPIEDNSRDALARRAAEISTRLVEGGSIWDLDSNDLGGALEYITQAHQRYYVNGNYNFELGLTGSKLHAVAFAAASAAMKISQAWYVRPSLFDPARFSIGVGESRFYSIRMPVL